MELLLIISSVVYVTRLLFFWVGQVRSARPMLRSDDSAPFVSIIVPARNEAERIERCVQSLVAVDYPRDRFEVLVVNDRSTDSTGPIIDSLASRYSVVRALHRRETEASGNLRGKPGALQDGIDHARGEILLLTDADCRVHSLWIRTMLAPFQRREVDMVCSFTTVRPSGLFAIIQDIEWLYSSSMAQAANTNRIPLGCYGNNMALRTSAFREIGGYRSIAFSVTEDLALMQAMVQRGSDIEYLCAETSMVETEPCTTLSEYLRQKQRWVQGGLELGWRGYAFAVSSVLYWVGLVGSLIVGSLPWFWGFLILRVIGDGILITNSALRLRRYYLLAAIAPTLLLLLLLELILPVLATQRTVRWKGQLFRT